MYCRHVISNDFYIESIKFIELIKTGNIHSLTIRNKNTVFKGCILVYVGPDNMQKKLTINIPPFKDTKINIPSATPGENSFDCYLNDIPLTHTTKFIA